ncbi:hypothetical protein [Zavarzinia sp. CC-PAN008]|uniref:hypothetical protein n=1 Tax=Zavarzinia sp. CC-PAN008 TaxID=3243332 RepID=UPI003F746E37
MTRGDTRRCLALLHFLLARLREPSTYGGLAALLTAAGWSVPDGLWDQGVASAIALAGLMAMLLTERRP